MTAEEIPMTTATALGSFARELSSFEEISTETVQDLVVIAAKALTEDGTLMVKSDV